MGIRVEVKGDEEIARRFANSPARLAKLQSAMDAHLALIHGAVVPLTPAFQGTLRASWQQESRVGFGRVEGVLGSAMIYAEVIERGRRAGAAMPPPDAIAPWVARKMGPEVSPFVVARAISRKGIAGRGMLAKAVAIAHGPAQGIWDATISGLVDGS